MCRLVHAASPATTVATQIPAAICEHASSQKSG